MDFLLEAKIKNITAEIENLLTKETIDTYNSKIIMSLALHRINLLMIHIGYLESKLDSTIESNRILTVNAENIVAENQRLSQIAKY